MAGQPQRRVLDKAAFGDFIVTQLDDLIKKLHPGLRNGTVDVALSFRVTIGKDGDCKCKRVCTEMPDGGVECVDVCTGTGCGQRATRD